MDKETLSNYGWIVIYVLVLAVMLALATPFGTFVSDAVKSTTQGLFDVNQNALNSTGLINIDGQEFDSCAHEYEMTGTTANCTTVGTTTYTCKLCNKSYSEETPAQHKVTNGACEYCGIALGVMTLDGVDYYYENDMTWGEWVESEYNTGGYKVVKGFRYIGQSGYYPNMTFFMNPEQDKYIAGPESVGRLNPSETTLIRSHGCNWTIFPFSDTGMEPVE